MPLTRRSTETSEAGQSNGKNGDRSEPRVAIPNLS